MITPTDRDPYEVLQVRPDADQRVVRAAYRTLAAVYHPDRNPNGVAERHMRELNAAYARVRTPELRRAMAEAPAPTPAPAAATAAPSAATAAATVPAPRRNAGDTSPTVDFGRYQGWSIAQLAREDPDYLRWLSRHSSGLRYRREIADRLAAGRPTPAPTAAAFRPRRWAVLGR